MTQQTDSIELPGLDGTNPLAFLAALGVLRCLDASAKGDVKPRLGWSSQSRPLVYPSATLSREALLEILNGSVKQFADDGAASLGDVIGVPHAEFRKWASPRLADPCDPAVKFKLLFASAYASDAVVDSKKATVIPTSISFSNGQGGKLLLKDFRTLAGRLTIDRLRAAVFEPWCYADGNEPTFRWDPLDMRTGAHMATDPGSTETRSVMAANALAFVGLSFLTCAPMRGDLCTTGFHRIDDEQCFTWPLWAHPISVDVVAALLQQNSWPESAGITARFASRRIMFKKNLYLGGSFAM